MIMPEIPLQILADSFDIRQAGATSDDPGEVGTHGSNGVYNYRVTMLMCA